MPAEIKKEIELEIAHVFFIDIVGYSKLSIDEQNARLHELIEVVRGTEQFQKAEAAGPLDSRSQPATGWRWYFTPVRKRRRNARSKSAARYKEHPRLQLRMGIHSGRSAASSM